jgi:hypothetical protein
VSRFILDEMEKRGTPLSWENDLERLDSDAANRSVLVVFSNQSFIQPPVLPQEVKRL